MARKKSRVSTRSYKNRYANSKKEMDDGIDSNEVENSPLHNFFKIVVIVAAIPLITGFLCGLIAQINLFQPFVVKSVYWGIASYVLMHLFIFEPVDFYKETQKFIQLIFGFLSPLFKVSYYLMPFWAIVVIACYFPAKAIFSGTGLAYVFYFLTAFVFTMHVVMVAAILRTEELKGYLDYMFVLVVVIAINIFFMALNFKLYEPEVSIAFIGKAGVETIRSTCFGILSFVRGIVG